MELPWVKRQVLAKLGFEAYPGTLNLRLTKDGEKRKQLENVGSLLVLPEIGYYSGVLFKAKISSLNCAVVVPLVPNYPYDLLEVIAPVYLRGKLGLKDGDLATVTVTI